MTHEKETKVRPSIVAVHVPSQSRNMTLASRFVRRHLCGNAFSS